MTDQEMITFAYDDFITPTAKAFLVMFGDEKVWLPQSLKTGDGQPGKNKPITVDPNLADR